MKSAGHKAVIAISLLAACSSVQVSTGSSGVDHMGKTDLPHIEGYVPIMPGSDMEIHKVALWRQQPDFYTDASYINPKTGKKGFNSCMDKDVSAQKVCNSHGICAPFDRHNIVKPMWFCKCDLGWAGAQCTLRQKSQMTAWLLSLFLGFTGVDEYYLGFGFWFTVKAFGFFVGCVLYALDFRHGSLLLVLSIWFYDIVRIGSGTVYSHDAKVAADLPHWAFASFTLLFFAFLGFCMGVCKVYWCVKEKRRKSDVERNYCACDAFGAPNNAPINKPYGDHYHVFGWLAPKPWSPQLPITTLPKYVEPGTC